METKEKPSNPRMTNPDGMYASEARAEDCFSLRDHYAGLAMQGLLANPQYWKRVYKTLSSLKADKDSIECVFAQFSIKLADEILEQLEEK